MTIGDRALINSRAQFKLITEYFEQTFEPRLTIGDDVYLGSGCEIVCIESVTSAMAVLSAMTSTSMTRAMVWIRALVSSWTVPW